MIKQISIQNIALIEEVKINFDNGLNVLSGETGAGKSIIIDSLNFLLGKRADKTLIKHGKDFAFVEGVFEIEESETEILEYLKDINIEPETTIIINRTMTLVGKNTCKINGEIVSLSMLKKLCDMLVDIFGQHDQQILLDNTNHLEMLDQLDSKSINNLKENLHNEISTLNNINNKINELGGDEASRERLIDILRFEIEQIENANLSQDEYNDLIKEKSKLINAEKIYENLKSVTEILNGDYSLLSNLKNCSNYLSNIEEFDNTIQSQKDRINSSRYELEDICDTLNSILNDINFSPERLDEIEERLDLISTLKRKYGATINDIIVYLNNSKDKLYSLENCKEQIKILNKEKDLVLSNIYDICLKLTNERQNLSKLLENKIIIELKELGMKNAQFKVSFNNTYNLENIESKHTLNGADNVEFLFSANLGEELKPLNKIISGGELSRFMLGFKCISNELNIKKSFVFDEIDNGIGGTTGTTVAQKLAKISKTNQVLCVTHLAQICAFADCNFKVEKTEVENKTKSTLYKLDDNAKIIEISRMIGSTENNEFAQLHAKELINEASLFKSQL